MRQWHFIDQSDASCRVLDEALNDVVGLGCNFNIHTVPIHLLPIMEGRLDFITGSGALGYTTPSEMIELLFRCFINLKPRGLMFLREVVGVTNRSRMGDSRVGWYNRYCPETLEYILGCCGFVIKASYNLRQLSHPGDVEILFVDMFYVIRKSEKFRGN